MAFSMCASHDPYAVPETSNNCTAVSAVHTSRHIASVVRRRRRRRRQNPQAAHVSVSTKRTTAVELLMTENTRSLGSRRCSTPPLPRPCRPGGVATGSRGERQQRANVPVILLTGVCFMCSGKLDIVACVRACLHCMDERKAALVIVGCDGGGTLPLLVKIDNK